METLNTLSHFLNDEVFPSVMIWSVLALIIIVFIRFAPRLDSILRYHLAAATLLSLPIGMLFGFLLPAPLFPAATTLPFLSLFPSLDLQPIVITADGFQPSGSDQISYSLNITTASSVFVLASISVGLMRLSLIYFRLKRACAKAQPITDTRVIGLLEEIRSDLGIKRNVALKSLSGVGIPFTTGHFSPLIVLPDSYPQDETHLRIVLTHELIHIARKDYLIHFYELLLRHVFWMHPFVHILYKQSTYWREVSCDTQVLKLAGSHTGTYAQLLYDFALKSQEKPIFKAAMAEESNLLRRIRAFSTQTNPIKEITMKNSITTATAIFLLIGGLMACSSSINGDTPTPPQTTLTPEVDGDESTEFFVSVEQMPTMIGGIEALFNFLKYPQEAKEAGHQGRAIIQFIVDEEGNVLDPTVVRSSDHLALDNAAIEAIKQVQFEPGMKDGQPVKVQMVQPVVFRLQ